MVKALTHEVTVNTVYIGFVVSFVLPQLTALVTHRLAHPGLKAAVLLVLSVAAGAGQQILAAHGKFVPSQLALWAGTTFLGAVVAHFGLTKPAGLSGSGGILARSLPGGMGAPKLKPVAPPVQETHLAR